MSSKPPARIEIDSYLQHLLALQYHASSFFQHKPTKGDLREDFIKRLICKEYNIQLEKGILSHQEWQSSQIDCILLQPGARRGDLSCFDVADVKVCMEIKSCASTQEIKNLNDISANLKQRNNQIKVGMFAYTTRIQSKNIFKKFGILFDEELQSFNAYQHTKDLYPNIDFLFVLEAELNQEGKSAYYIMRGSNNQRIWFLQNPVISSFLYNFKPYS